MPRGKKNVPVVEEIEDVEEELGEMEEEDSSEENWDEEEEEGSDSVGDSTNFEHLVAETFVYVIETLEQLAEKSKVSNLEKVLDKGDALVEAWEDRLATE